MKKLLYYLLVLNIIGIVLGFILGLFASFFYSILVVLLGILELAPIIAIINNIDSIEHLYKEVYEIKYKLKEPDDKKEDNTPDGTNPSSGIERRETARGAWECVKCGTVNKAGTDTCQNCKANYSPFVNPTANPYEKKKVSRWIKNK